MNQLDFRVFIDAATLKVDELKTNDLLVLDFRVFIDAATLKVTAKQIEEWSKMPKKTLWRWLEKLEKARRIASVSDMTQTPIQDSCGVPHETTLYNLNVLNQLAMVCIDNENPLLQHTKARGFLFVVVKFTGAWSFYDGKCFDKKPEISANLRL